MHRPLCHQEAVQGSQLSVALGYVGAPDGAATALRERWTPLPQVHLPVCTAGRAGGRLVWGEWRLHRCLRFDEGRVSTFALRAAHERSRAPASDGMRCAEHDGGSSPHICSRREGGYAWVRGVSRRSRVRGAPAHTRLYRVSDDVLPPLLWLRSVLLPCGVDVGFVRESRSRRELHRWLVCCCKQRRMRTEGTT